jgi:hypothetical protein
MTISRTAANTEKPRLIDSLERVADDLVSYLTEMERVRDLIQQIDQAGKEYKKPLQSWIWYPIYVWSRTRGPVVNALILSIQQRGSSETLLDAIDQFFSFGGWETTSVNTYLMQELVLALPDYADTRENFSLHDKDNRSIKRLKELFLERTNKILRPTVDAEQPADKDAILKRKMKLESELIKLTKELSNAPEVIAVQPETENILLDQQKQQREAELQQLRKGRDIRQNGKDLLDTNTFLPKRKAPINKLDEAKFAAVKMKLAQVFQQNLLSRGLIKPEDVVNQPVQGCVNMQLNVNKLDPERVKQLEKGLYGVMRSNLQKIEEERSKCDGLSLNTKGDLPKSTLVISKEDLLDAIITPPASPQLSKAAFEEPAVAAGKYVAPPRKKLEMNDQQLRAMNRLFAAPAPVVEKETQSHSPSLK